MSDHIKKNKIKQQTLQEFKKVDIDLLEDRYNRYCWTIQEWKRIVKRKINLPPHIHTLYWEGSGAFFYGYFTASILTITATIELTLKAIVNLSELGGKKKNFQNIINKAVSQKIISQELGKDLHFLRKNTRNILSHEHNMASHLTVGWEKDPESKTRYMLSDERLEKLAILQRDSKESLFVSREVFAKEALQLLYRVFNGCLTSGKNWKIV